MLRFSNIEEFETDFDSSNREKTSDLPRPCTVSVYTYWLYVGHCSDTCVVIITVIQ